MCTPILPAEVHPFDPQARIWLAVNDQLRQEGTLSQLIWTVPELIVSLSRLVRLEAGDLIYTGTPAGVGPIGPGDRVTSGVEGVGRLDFEVV